MSIDTRIWVATLLVWAAASHTPTAQGGANKLEAVKALSCDFTVLATGTWTSGAPQAKVEPKELTVGFNEIDTQEGSAGAVGGYGPAHVVVRLSGKTLHFLQVSTSGPIYLTSVFDSPTKDGKFKA